MAGPWTVGPWRIAAEVHGLALQVIRPTEAPARRILEVAGSEGASPRSEDYRKCLYAGVGSALSAFGS